MYKILLALHILVAVFAIGPLAHAATTASRGIRTSDPAATAAAARMLRIYSIASVLVVVLGMGLMSTTNSFTHRRTAEFGDTYIWLSIVLWAVAIALILSVLHPALTKATALIGQQEPVDPLTARTAAAGGIVGLIFAGIVFLMVYRPGG